MGTVKQWAKGRFGRFCGRCGGDLRNCEVLEDAGGMVNHRNLGDCVQWLRTENARLKSGIVPRPPAAARPEPLR